MKIQVCYIPQKEDVFVWGLWGPRTIEYILTRMAENIEATNKELRSIV